MDLYSKQYGKLYCYKLPLVVLKNSFIEYGKKYSDEEYLIEFINKSRFAKDKGGKFIHQKVQSHSECDAYNDVYAIDFKRLGYDEYFHARFVTEPKIRQYKEVLGYYIPGKPVSMNYYDVFELIQNDSQILMADSEIEGDKFDAVDKIRDILKTKKNLLILLPYEFEFYQVDTDENVAKEIISLLYDSLKTMMKYRKSQVDEKFELYFIFKSKDYMILVEANNDIKFYDYVPYKCSKLFSELWEYTWLEYGERIPCNE